MCVTDFIDHELAKRARWRRFGVGELDAAIERVNFPGRAREVIRHTPVGREFIEDPYISCTMVTCEPNEKVTIFNDRIPVILEERDFEIWLDPEASARDILSVCQPCDADRITVMRGLAKGTATWNLPR